MGDLQGLAVLVMLLGIFSTIFWMVVSWRAMKAHEKLADAVERMMLQQSAIREMQSRSSQDE
ncbi:hypothetical protein C6503_01540 [Candidatus Poribacteria bacterium]|nr:MAG: hypothetical protein C6503_01540 [Candidatus Poribacteria bacterium]